MSDNKLNQNNEIFYIDEESDCIFNNFNDEIQDEVFKSEDEDLLNESIKSINNLNPKQNFKYKTFSQFTCNKNKINDCPHFILTTENQEESKNDRILPQTVNQRITINVGGVRFQTYRETLKLISESRLANLSPTNSDYDYKKNEYFFDRDPNSFLAILNYLRSGRLHVPLNTCGNLFYDELNFWGIGERSIQPCCWTTYSAKRDCDEILKKVIEEGEDDIEYYSEVGEDRVPAFSNTTNKDSVIKIPRENKKNWFIRALKTYYSRIRPSVWKFLDDRSSSLGATIFFWISVVFLITSLINFVLETSEYGRIPYEVSKNKSLSRRERESLTVPHPQLLKIEFTCNIFFTIEYVLRFLSSPDKIKFLKNPYSFLEFLAISPVFWPTETFSNKNSWGVKVHNYIEVFYILRILRIFTLVPKYSGLRVLLLTLKNSIGELMLYMVMLFMTIMLFASFIYYAEQIFEEEDNKFDSILIGLWWAIVTMTTLGYGDIVPVTPFGYFVGGLCALSGLLFLALPVPVIVNNFTLFYSHVKAREKLKEYSDIQKSLPNRAMAVHFHHNHDKSSNYYWFNSRLSIQNNHSFERKNISELFDLRHTKESSKTNVNKSRSSIHIFDLNDEAEKNKSYMKNNKKRIKSYDGKVLDKWKSCKRRTIRRNAITEINLNYPTK